jgi:hypothetical protein
MNFQNFYAKLLFSLKWGVLREGNLIRILVIRFFSGYFATFLKGVFLCALVSSLNQVVKQNSRMQIGRKLPFNEEGPIYSSYRSLKIEIMPDKSYKRLVYHQKRLIPCQSWAPSPIYASTHFDYFLRNLSMISG